MTETQKQMYDAVSKVRSYVSKNTSRDFFEIPRREADAVVKSIPEGERQHFIFAAAAWSERFDAESAFHDIVKECLSQERITSLYIQWVVSFPRLKFYSNYVPRRFPGFPTPSWRHNRRPCLDRDTTLESILAVIQHAPDDSDAYVEGTSEFLSRFQSSVAIDSFREVWSSLSPARREAIAIGIHPEPWQLVDRGRHEQIVVVQNLTSRLELISGQSDCPPRTLNRCRWIDQRFPLLRGSLWAAINSAMKRFSDEVEQLGGEREQVGALLQALMQAYRNNQNWRGSRQNEIANQSSRMRIERYIFRTKEENLWGPDFALVFLYSHEDTLSIGRYVLFQAKLIQSGSIKVRLGQLADMLRSSWHSSFYIAWQAKLSPRCISTANLHNLIRHAGSGRGSSASPSIQWTKVASYGDDFADLLADRFLCGELGDPIPPEWGHNATDVATRIAELFGPPRHGILTFTVNVGGEFDQGEGPVQVAAEDIDLWNED